MKKSGLMLIALCIFGIESARAAEVGVRACDEFLSQYDACVDTKLSSSQREPFKKQIAELKKSWSAAASTPKASMEAIERSCVEYADKVRAVFRPFGCTF